MTLRLIVGRASSGKSTLVYDEITSLVRAKPDGAPLWLLVPEQTTFLAEQALADRLGGIMRVRVVSFQRLAHIVMNEVSGAALAPISELGRRMLVRKSIEDHKRELKQFSRAANQPGFTDKVVELISEFKRYRVKPAQLYRILHENGEQLSPTLRSKLHDLCLIYTDLSTRYSEIGFDTEDGLELLYNYISAYSPLAGTEIWIDSFSGFSPQEYAILERLMHLSNVHISIAMDPVFLRVNLTEGHPFFTPWETAMQVRALATHAGVQSTCLNVEVSDVYLKPLPLMHLERGYLQRDYPALRGVFPEVAVLGAANRLTEVEIAANEIIRLCRDDGYRYRDLCLIVRDIEIYEQHIKTLFRALEIPVFIDKKRQVKHHPLLDLVRAAIEAVLQDFPYEPVMRCLKSDLFSLSREEIDWLDNLALATGVRGRRWLSEDEWRIPKSLNICGDINTIQAARAQVANILRPLESGLNSSQNVSEYTQALYSFLESLQVTQTLESWAQEAILSGDLDTANLHLQVFDAVSQLLQEVEATLGAEEIPLSEFARILETGLEGITLGLIPPGVDQVIVAELGRSRSPVVKGAFILGANEGVLPARSRRKGLLSDEERSCLGGLSLGLGPTARRQLFDEEYLIYTGLTRPRTFLRISYALSDDSGAPLVPSLVVRRLQELFPDLSVAITPSDIADDPHKALERMQHRSTALAYLSTQLLKAKNGIEVSSLWWDVYNGLISHAGSRPRVATVVRGLFHRLRLEPLSSSIISQLYGRRLRGSVSRLEKYAACPFAYFASYGLRLKKRPIYKLAAVDLGNFFHEALDRFVGRLHSEKLDWAQLTKEQYRKLTQAVVDDIVPELDSDILLSSARYRHLTKRLQQVVERSARVLGRQAQRGAFRPVAVEVGFGGNEDVLPALKVELSDGSMLEMVGRIDRIDTAEQDGKLYLRIIDYKSGHSKLTALEVYYGLKIQLLTYLEVALVNALKLFEKEAMPAAALYFRLQDPLLSSDVPLDASRSEEMSFKSFKHSGMVIAESEVVGLMDKGLQGWSEVLPIMAKADGTYVGDSAWTKNKLAAMLSHVRSFYARAGESIISGSIDIAPFRLGNATACQFCEHHAVCQFDTRLSDGAYRELKKLSPLEVWTVVGAEAEGEQ